MKIEKGEIQMLLNREELLDALDAKRKECHLENEYIGFDLAYSIVESMGTEPDVQPGKWIVTAGGKECDCPVCGEWFDNTCNYDIRKTWKWCPVCGTRLEVDGE